MWGLGGGWARGRGQGTLLSGGGEPDSTVTVLCACIATAWQADRQAGRGSVSACVPLACPPCWLCMISCTDVAYVGLRVGVFHCSAVTLFTVDILSALRQGGWAECLYDVLSVNAAVHNTIHVWRRGKAAPGIAAGGVWPAGADCFCKHQPNCNCSYTCNCS